MSLRAPPPSRSRVAWGLNLPEMHTWGPPDPSSLSAPRGPKQDPALQSTQGFRCSRLRAAGPEHEPGSSAPDLRLARTCAHVYAHTQARVPGTHDTTRRAVCAPLGGNRLGGLLQLHFRWHRPCYGVSYFLRVSRRKHRLGAAVHAGCRLQSRKLSAPDAQL